MNISNSKEKDFVRKNCAPRINLPYWFKSFQVENDVWKPFSALLQFYVHIGKIRNHNTCWWKYVFSPPAVGSFYQWGGGQHLWWTTELSGPPANQKWKLVLSLLVYAANVPTSGRELTVLRTYIRYITEMVGQWASSGVYMMEIRQ